MNHEIKIQICQRLYSRDFLNLDMCMTNASKFGMLEKFFVMPNMNVYSLHRFNAPFFGYKIWGKKHSVLLILAIYFQATYFTEFQPPNPGFHTQCLLTEIRELSRGIYYSGATFFCD